MTDNIEHPKNEKIDEPQVQFQTEKQHGELTLVQACQEISKHYNRPFKNLDFVCPMQLVDGSVVDFVDRETDRNMATARLRYRNHMSIDKQTGAMLVQAYLSDLRYQRDTINISVGTTVISQ